MVAEFKPKEERQQLESDFVKVGKSMRIMLNEILEICIEDPVVYGILIKNDKLLTFKMYMADAKIYVMSQFFSIPHAKSSDDLPLISGIVSRLEQLKVYQDRNDKLARYFLINYFYMAFFIKSPSVQATKTKNGKTIVGGSVPTS